jgi:hypothetical protein
MTDQPSDFPPAELAQRRRAARRLAWLLGLAVVALYVIGLFIKR